MSTERKMHVHYRLSGFNPPMVIGPNELRAYAKQIGFNEDLKSRTSNLLLTQTIYYSQQYGIEVEQIVHEIKHLDGLPGHEVSQTKQSTPLKNLESLHHKHFTSSTINMVASNISAARPKSLIRKIAEEELGGGASIEALQRFTDRIVIDGYEERASCAKLTGEWIVFTQHNGFNYYLCLATHSGGDQEIMNYIDSALRIEFPELGSKFTQILLNAKTSS